MTLFPPPTIHPLMRLCVVCAPLPQSKPQTFTCDSHWSLEALIKVFRAALLVTQVLSTRAGYITNKWSPDILSTLCLQTISLCLAAGSWVWMSCWVTVRGWWRSCVALRRSRATRPWLAPPSSLTPPLTCSRTTAGTAGNQLPQCLVWDCEYL